MKFLSNNSNKFLALSALVWSHVFVVATAQGHNKQQVQDDKGFVRAYHHHHDNEQDDSSGDQLMFATWNSRDLQNNNVTNTNSTNTTRNDNATSTTPGNETDTSTGNNTNNNNSTNSTRDDPNPGPSPVDETGTNTPNSTSNSTRDDPNSGPSPVDETGTNTTNSTRDDPNPGPSPVDETGTNTTNTTNTTNNNNNATEKTAAPTSSQMPSISPPTPSPVPPTPYPTPSTPYNYPQWGESTFGYKYQNLYEPAFQLSTRRPGWSWHQPIAGYAPFCYEETCYDVTEPCEAYGGVLLNNVTCAFPEDVKIAGPSCWQENCTTSGGRDACDSIGGMTVGDDDRVQWCLFKDARTLLGPACYREDCYKTELKEYCDGAGGVVWNEDYCFIPGFHTVIGPVCWNEYCFAGSLNPQCASMDGTALAGRWCVVEGCDRTVLGPLCSKAEASFLDECYGERNAEVCTELEGVLFADFICVVEGTDWTLMGPNVYGTDGETRGITNRLCRELQDNIGGPFSGLKTYDIEGRFCLIKMRVPPVGPFCLGDECQPERGTEFCSAFEGEDLEGFMCLLPPKYQQGFGPLVWNDNMLEAPNGTCVGQFCAIQFDSYDTDLNVRCPAAGPIAKAPTPVPPPATPSPQPTNTEGETAPPAGNGGGPSGAVSVFKPLVSLLVAMAISYVLGSLTRM